MIPNEPFDLHSKAGVVRCASISPDQCAELSLLDCADEWAADLTERSDSRSLSSDFRSAQRATMAQPAAASPSPAPIPFDVLSLPEEVLQSILEMLSTFELLQILAANPPSKSWARAWYSLPHFDVDLERDVGRAIKEAAAAAAAQQQSAAGDSGSNSNTNSSGGGNSLVVRQMLARKQTEYIQLLHLLAAHAKDLQTLSLSNFGVTLQNDIAPLSASHKPIHLLSTLGAHSGSLTSLALTGSSLRRVDLGPEFHRLISLDLSRSKGLQDPRLDLPNLTSLDLSRTLLNDLELARILPNLFSLRILKLIGCKNLRIIGGGDPALLFQLKVSHLKIIDLSNTAVIDSSVNGIVRFCLELESLFLADCSELHQPRLCSSSLKTLCLRGCNRLKMSTRIWCPVLQELDLSKSNLRDGWIDGTGSSNGGVEGLGVSRGGSGGCIHIPSIRTLLLQACYELVNPLFRIEQGTDEIIEEQIRTRAERAAAGGSIGETPGTAPSTVAMTYPTVSTDSSAVSAGASSSSSSSSTLLPQVYPHLTSLDLGLSYSFSNKALMHLLAMAPNLEVLDLQQCKNVCSEWSDDDAPEARDDRVDVFPPGLSKLRELYARGCSLSDENLALLLNSEAGLSLEVLILRNCNKVTGRGLTRGPRLRELDLRLTQLTDELLAELLAHDRLPQLRVLNIAQCSKLLSPVLAHGSLEVLDASSCAALKSLTLATPSLKTVDVSLCFSLTQLDLSECSKLQSLNAQHSTAVHVTSPLMHASRDNGSSITPLMLAGNGGLVENGLYAASAALGPKDAASRPLRAYSGAAAYREYTSQTRAAQSNTAASREPSSASSSSSSSGAGTGAGSSSQLSGSKIGSSSASSSSAVAFGAKGNASLFDSVPLPAHGGAKRELAMTHSARPVVYNSDAYGLARTPPRASHVPASASSVAASESTPPGSPARRIQQQLSPASRTAAAGGSPPRRRSSHPSLAPAPAAAAAASPAVASASLPPLSPPASSPHRGIRSVDVCILEENVASLESKLAAETSALATLLAQPVDGADAAAAAWASNVKDTKLQIYGLKKQLQVQRAKLKKEMRRVETENENTGENDAAKDEHEGKADE